MFLTVEEFNATLFKICFQYILALPRNVKFQNMPSKSHLWSIVFGQYMNLKYFVVVQVQVSSKFPVGRTCTPNQVWKQKKIPCWNSECFLWIVREWNSEVNFIWNLKFILLFMEESNEYFLWKRTTIISFKTRRTCMYVTGSNKKWFQKKFRRTKSLPFFVQKSFFSVGMHSRARARIFVAYFFGLIFALDRMLLLDQAIGNESNYWQSARDFEWIKIFSKMA